MPRFQHSGGSHAYIWIVSSWVLNLEKIRVAPTAFWKRRNETHCPSVDRNQTIGFGRHACLLQPASQGGNARVGVRQHQDGLVSRPFSYCFGNEVSFSAAGWGC